MNSRKGQLLNMIVEQHISTAQPVGSKLLCSKEELGVSAATIRNEMRDLEMEGFLEQPHISAGRVPTESGYRYYIEDCAKKKKISKKRKEEMDRIIGSGLAAGDTVKELAKHVAGSVQNAVIVALNRNFLYYTGISFLFAQPEFQNHGYAVSISRIFDRCEELIGGLSEVLDGGGVKVLLGSENPFGASCSLVGARLGNSIFTVLGPIRMDYSAAHSMVEYLRQSI